MESCNLSGQCEFFLRYSESSNESCQGFISCYCQGPLVDRCARKGFALEGSGLPDVRMMPTGEMVD